MSDPIEDNTGALEENTDAIRTSTSETADLRDNTVALAALLEQMGQLKDFIRDGRAAERAEREESIEEERATRRRYNVAIGLLVSLMFVFAGFVFWNSVEQDQRQRDEIATDDRRQCEAVNRSRIGSREAHTLSINQFFELVAANQDPENPRTPEELDALRHSWLDPVIEELEKSQPIVDC